MQQLVPPLFKIVHFKARSDFLGFKVTFPWIPFKCFKLFLRPLLFFSFISRERVRVAFPKALQQLSTFGTQTWFDWFLFLGVCRFPPATGCLSWSFDDSLGRLPPFTVFLFHCARCKLNTLLMGNNYYGLL